LASLAAALREARSDLELHIIDAPALNLSLEETAREIVAREPDALGVTAATMTAEAVRWLCRRVKWALPDCLTIVGGPHPSALPDDLLDAADAAIIGEGERTLIELIERPHDFAAIRGVAWRNGERVTVNARRPPIGDLDTLPPPAYDLLPIGRYRYPYPLRAAPGRYATYMTARGCLGRCAFCAKSALWGDSLRRHSIARVMRDVSALVERHRVSLLYFYDDTFLADRARAEELAVRLRREQPALRWICQGRADELDRDLAVTLQVSGCVQIEIGVERATRELRREAVKDIDDESVRRAFTAARFAGLETKANFIFGFPDETPETLHAGAALARELNPTYVNFFHLVPLPGSAYFDLYRRKGWLATLDWRRFGYHGRALVAVPGASPALLDRAKRSALARFYLRPRKVWELVSAMRRSGDAATVARGLAALANGLLAGPFSGARDGR
jgi:anaerobic magnesium-protoporphyrin IX monomethyl ester cyclase